MLILSGMRGRLFAVNQPASKAHIIPVTTMNYRGLWLEDDFTPAGFQAAQAARVNDSLDTAGAIVPTGLASGCQAAQEAGYVDVGQYHWWMRVL